MKERKVEKKVKNVIPNLKAKRESFEGKSFFAMLQITPQDVYDDANEEHLYVEEKVQEEIVKPKKKKKFNKQLLSWAFIFLNIIIVAVIFINMSLDGSIAPIDQLFAESPYYRFLFIGLGLMLLVLFIEGLKLSFISKTTTGKFRLITTINTAVIGRYWDCITPMATGGQPFQIYYLSKHGYSIDNATGIPFAKHLFWTISFCIISLIVVFTPVKIGDDIGHVVKGFAWVGIIGNLLLFCFIMLMSFNSKLGTKIINFFIKILHKLKIIKNYENAVEKMQVMFLDYQQCIKKSMKKPGHFFVQLILAGMNILLNATIAYCIYLAFNYTYILNGSVIAIEWMQIVCLSILCDAAASLMPLPGGSGAAELSFIGLFGLLFRDDMKIWAMLFWRIFTYYGIIVVGLIFVVGNSIVANRKRNKMPAINTKWTN